MSRTILVVDDDDAIRETFELHLKCLGCDVSLAASAEEALQKVSEAEPALVITDVRMPGSSGLDLLAALQAAAPDVDVVVITAFEDMQTAIDAMKAGAYDYLVKPVDLDRIELIVERCLRERATRRRIRQFDEESAAQYGPGRLIGADPGMLQIYKMVGTLARGRTTVLIRGETGTGKEVIARAIHFNSPDASEPFIAVNCTAVPEDLLESELFGHVRGAFTGAVSDRKGRFELAGHGTIFLDEIGDTSTAFQAKLLRVLQAREFHPVGGDRARRTDARVIAATHRPIEQLVREGRFREDLYYRLRVVELGLPPLRERRADIRVLAEHFVARASRDSHREILAISPEALRVLEEDDWPGNVRELENTIIRAVALTRGKTIMVEDLALGITERDEDAPTPGDESTAGEDRLDTVERSHVERILAKTGGNKRRASQLLGISRSRLDRLIAKHGLVVPEGET
jgi:DNA-binding NtrC family response regulator